MRRCARGFFPSEPVAEGSGRRAGFGSSMTFRGRYTPKARISPAPRGGAAGGCVLEAAPLETVPPEKLVGFGRSCRARGVRADRRPFARVPQREERVDDRPRRFDLVGAREE